MFSIILLPIEVNMAIQKKSCKKNMIRAFSPNNGKVILILLTKIVKFYVRLTIIYV